MSDGEAEASTTGQRRKRTFTMQRTQRLGICSSNLGDYTATPTHALTTGFGRPDDDLPELRVKRRRLDGGRIGKPQPYTDTHDAQAWIEAFEAYCTMCDEDSSNWVNLCRSYLGPKAMEWVRRKRVASLPWMDFKRQFVGRFGSLTDSRVSRAQLLQLKQTGSVEEYTRKFQDIADKLDEIGDPELVDLYASGLKGGVALHLFATGVDKLDEAIRIALNAERGFLMIDSCRGTERTGRQLRDSRGATGGSGTVGGESGPSGGSWTGPASERRRETQGEGSGGGADRKTGNVDSQPGASRPSYQPRRTPEERSELQKSGACYRCGQKGHLARNCPGETAAKSVSKSGTWSTMYAVTIYGQRMAALIDSGASTSHISRYNNDRGSYWRVLYTEQLTIYMQNISHKAWDVCLTRPRMYTSNNITSLPGLLQVRTVGSEGYELVYGKRLDCPLAVAVGRASVPEAKDLIEWRTQLIDEAKANMLKAQARQKAQADRQRREMDPIVVGDEVLVSTKNIRLAGPAKFKDRYLGPCKVTAANGVNVTVELPKEHSKIHPTFHVSLVKKYVKDHTGLERPLQPVPAVHTEGTYEVERILDRQGSGKQARYLVRWAGYSADDDSWLSADNVLLNCPDLVREFEEANG